MQQRGAQVILVEGARQERVDLQEITRVLFLNVTQQFAEPLERILFACDPIKVNFFQLEFVFCIVFKSVSNVF